MGKGDYRISDIYQGGYSGLVPPSNNYMTAGSFGMTTDPRSANVLQEVSTKLSMGVKNIEVTAISSEAFDSMPKQHLKEVNRLAKLTGIDITLHGPLIEASGVSQQGYSEPERESAQIKIANALIRSHDLNPDGNIPVTFHSSNGLPGSQLLPPEKRKNGEEYRKMIAVNKETGRMAPLETDKQYHPESEKLEPTMINPRQRLEMLNRTEWDNSISQMIFNKERADELLGKNRPLMEHLIEDIQTGKLNEQNFNLLPPDQQKVLRKYTDATTYLHDLHKQVSSLFSKAAEFADEHQKEELMRISENFRENISKNSMKSPSGMSIPNPFIEAEAMHDLLHNLKNPIITPKIWVPIEDFAVEKSSQTYGNAAYEAYKKFKDKSPILVIENPPAGGALSTGEDIKNIVVASRKQFVGNAVKEGMSESEANRQAEKFIGATWDVGHINMLRGLGYNEKDIIKETEIVAPYVKHVHLSDNFGLEHTELPMGMGNVPIKEMMEKLGQKGFEAKKIIEAGHWWQHFRTPPFQETLEAAGSPLYSMHMAPYWSQAPGLYQGYNGGLDGQWLPQINYETFGGSFSRLPKELGGSTQGAQGGRMSGRPME